MEVHFSVHLWSRKVNRERNSQRNDVGMTGEMENHLKS